MSIHNKDIADVFEQVADLLEIKGDNPFRIRAYRNAARTVGNLSRNVSDLISQEEDLTQYPGVGKDLAGKIEQVATTGELKLLERLRRQIPGELSELMKIPGLGPKRVATMYHELDISKPDQLQKAAEAGEIHELPGFGCKIEQNILDEVKRLSEEKYHQLKLTEAEQFAEPLIDYLKKVKGIKKITIAGSYRRRKDTVGDLDILATCQEGSKLMDRFVGYEDVEKVVSKGQTRSTVLLRSGFQVDLRIVPQVSYGAALMYFTGSKDHNIAVRKIALRKNLKLNEYGLFRGKKRIAGKTESHVYEALGLSFIEPELRENRGEIEAVYNGKGLPDLLTLNNVRGDLHIHTKYTDGHHTIRQMAEAAKNRGYEYIAITDHTKRLTVTGGLNVKELHKQMKEIEEVNENTKDMTILKASEVDILKDGSLDLPDSVLKELDLTVCAVHYTFGLSKEKQTERIMKAMDNPYFNILAHPSGRLINERQAYQVDMEKIMNAAKNGGCLLELNAHPDRLDLDDVHCQMAKEIGVKIVLSTDAHRMDGLDTMRFGVGQARRGWLGAENVANTRSLKELREIFNRN
ncbi:MAG: DNA polymerase/3'-5' exonuclease PolX [Sedimentisphaerales bacterium]|nr:DNA polymerase/3'-5' exonuclease PolX [Sedimentisphaerales bacterium]